MTSQKTTNKAITCNDDEYLARLISSRTEVVEIANKAKEKELEYKSISSISIEKQKEYIELAKRRYTLEFISFMIEESEEIFIESLLLGVKEKLLENEMEYSIELIEILMTNDKYLENIKNSQKNQELSKENKYAKSKFKKWGDYLFKL